MAVYLPLYSRSSDRISHERIDVIKWKIQPEECMLGRMVDILNSMDSISLLQLTVLNVLSYLIERVSVGIRDICQGLVHYLPHLWEASSDHEMLRCSILTTLIVIVQSLGTSSHSITDFVFR